MILRATRLSATGNNFRVGIHPEAQAYIDEIVFRGANPTFAQRIAISNFVEQEITSGRWLLHRRIYLPVWGVAAANAVDMVTRTSGSFVGGVTHGAGFVQGDGSSGFFDMLVTPVAAGLAPGNVCYWAHVLQAGSGTGFRAIQGTTQVGSRLLAAARNVGNTFFSMGDTSGGVTANLTVTDADGRGIYIASETATNSRFLRVRRSTGIALSTTNTATPTNPTFATVNQRVFCWNNNGSNSGYNDAQLSGYGLSLALSVADADAFTANLQNLWESVVFEGYDSDAVDFIRATGASDYQAINNWVVGLKSLGIWNNIVCWPMRSTQNHGSGTTALRSLGGLGSFNGTLVNGPQWGPNGISFDGVNDFVSIGGLPSLTALGSFASPSSPINSTSAGRCLIGIAPNGALALGIATGTATNEVVGSYAFETDTPNGVRYVLAHESLSTTISGFTGIQTSAGVSQSVAINGVNVSAASYNPRQPFIASSIRFGSRLSSLDWFAGSMALNYVANIDITPTQATQIYNLYRTTLGAGLGLP